MDSFQAVVIGAGPGGYVAAIRLAQLGVKTALIEKGALGGVCLNWGCIPSKAYINAAHLMHEIATAGEIGIAVSEPKMDLGKLKTWKDGIVTRLTGGIGQLLEKAGVTVIKGAARFLDGKTIAVKADGKETKVGYEKAIIATGSRSTEIPPFPFDGENILSSRHVLALEKLPKDFVVIGGGVIGLEIGMFMAQFGANVTIVEMMDQVLPGTDPDVVKVLSRVLKKRGIKVHTGARAQGFTKKKGGRLEVKIQDAKGKDVTIETDKVLVSVGRRPNTAELGLDALGVKLDERGFVVVDDQLRTNVKNVFAIGDVAGGALLAHKASKEGLVAAAVIAGKKESYDVRAMPAAIFTDPEIAVVGLGEEEARKKGHEVKAAQFPFSALGKAMAVRQTEGFVKIVSDAKTDRVLGVHIIGKDAANIISEAALAIEMGACVEDIALTVHPHPTMGESMMEAAEAVHGHAIHIFNPKR